jgi:competence protein ComEC
LNSGAVIQILWPDRQTDGKETLSDNDRSLVSLIEFAGSRILLCSDIEAYAQNELLRRYPDLKADVVVVPHHGSAATLVPEFVEKLDASILICSCDRRQYERARDGFVPAAGPQGRERMFYTFKDGAVSVRVNHDGALRTDRFTQ